MMEMDAATPRKRRRWLWLAVLAALGLGGYLALRALLDPERLSAFLLRQAGDATGLAFTLEQPAGVGFWPDLHLELTGLQARVPGSQSRVLRVERLDVVLPWAALREDTLQLRSLRLQAPNLDLAALRTWLAARRDAGPPAPIRLPRLDTELVASGGRISQGDWALTDVSLTLDALRDGEASELTVSAIAAGPDMRRPFALRLAFTPRQLGGALHLEALALDLSDGADAAAWLQASGQLALNYPQRLAFDLDIALPTWPEQWPALPLPHAAADAGVQVKLGFEGAPDLQGALKLRLARADEQLSGQLQLGALFDWIAAPAASPLPPVRGLMESPRLELEDVELRGVRLRIDDPAKSPADASD